MPALVGVEEMVVMVVLCEIVCMVYGINAWPVSPSLICTKSKS